jgi:hypothetical protein
MNGSPVHLNDVLPTLIVISLSLIGVIGTIAAYKKSGQTFWWTAAIFIGIPIIWWIHALWPSGGILMFFFGVN